MVILGTTSRIAKNNFVFVRARKVLGFSLGYLGYKNPVKITASGIINEIMSLTLIRIYVVANKTIHY